MSNDPSQMGPNGQQLLSWPGAPQFAPNIPAAPMFGSAPPQWTGATQADAALLAQQQQIATSGYMQTGTGIMGPGPGEPPFTGGQDVPPQAQGDKSAEQLVAEAKAEQAAKKAKKAAEAELRKKWATPWDRFNAWQAEFGFTIDACADETNHKLPRWIGPNSSVGVLDLLSVQMLPGESVWWNAWGFDETHVKKAWELMGRAAAERPKLIVQIRPSNQTEQPFWQEYVEQYRDWNGYSMLQPMGADFRVRFLTPRVEFVPPKPEIINGIPCEIKESSPRSGHVLLIWRNLWVPQAPAAVTP